MLPLARFLLKVCLTCLIHSYAHTLSRLSFAPERLLDTCDPRFFDDLAGNLRAAGEAAADGIMDSSRHHKLWRD